jgi:hypothetical protein
MNVNALRAILLVKNVEEQDPDGSVLPLAEREAATREALRRWPADGTAAADRQSLAWQVLATRAETLYEKLAERHPVVARALGLESQVASAGWLVLAAALALGLVLSLLDSRVRIEILAFPLLGIVLWNFVVYAILAVSSLRQGTVDPVATWAPGWVSWPARWGWRRAASLIRQAGFYHRPLAAALRRFSDEWWPVTQPLLMLHGKRLFHLGSAAVALGLVGGFYLRGIALEYRAGWESTFLDATQVRSLLNVLYGPASAITGIALPADDAATAALHWRNGAGGGPAGPWIHLMAATAFLFVMLPRLLLAAHATWQVARAGRELAVPEALLAYARQTLGASDAALPAQSARLTAYAYEPGAASGQGVQRLLRAAFGRDTRLEFAPGVAYGEEAAFDAPARGPAADLEVLLFSLAATPEAENHGAILQRALQRLSGAAAGSRLLVLVDEAPYLARMSGDASLHARIEQRREAWREFVHRHGLEPCLVDLAALPADAVLSQPILDRVHLGCRRRGA